MGNQNKIVESILAKEKAKGAPKPEDIKPTQGMSIAEKIVAKEQGTQQQLADLTARIGANAEAMQSAISYKDAQKAKARVADLGKGLTLDQYPTFEEQQAERAQFLAETKMAEAKAKANKEFYETKVGDRGKELVGEASKRLGGTVVPEKPTDVRDEQGRKLGGALYKSHPDVQAYEKGQVTHALTKATGADYISFEDMPEKAREEARKIAEAYVAKHPEDAYDVENLTNYFANEIYGSAHQTRVNNDDKYMREAFKATTGMEYETYMRNYANKLKREIKALRDQSYATAERDARSRADYDLMQPSNELLRFSPLEGKAAGEVASKPYDDMLEQIEAWEENDFSSGFSSGFDTSNFLSFGLVDVLNNYKTNEALGKAYRGEKLSSEEERLVRLMQIQQEFEDIRKELYEPQGWMSSIGEGVGTTVNMLPEFAVSMGLTGGLGSFSKMGTMAQLKNALKVGGDDLLNYGASTLRKGAYNYGLAKGRGLIAAPLMPTTYNTYFDTLNSGYSFNEDGNLTYTPVDKTQAYFGSVFSTANEISSEYLGIGIGSAIGWGGTKLGKMIANTRVGGVATRATNKVRKYIPKLSPEAKVAMRTLGVQADPVSETLSEALGDIMTSYEQSMIGMDVDMSKYGTFDYWMTLAGVSLVYGGTMATLGAVKSYRDVKNAVKERDAILGKISNRNLYNTLLAASTSDDVVLASSALADFDWKANDISPEDKRYARDFRVADLNVKVMQGAVEEGTRLAQFEGALENMRGIVYQESAGEPSDKIYEAEMDGKPVYVINGLEEGNTTDLVVVVDPATGNKSSVDKSKITPTRQYTVDEYIDEMYSKAFSLEEETKRVEDVKAKALQMENPTEKDVQRVASTLDITLPKVGDAVMLANGNMGSVTERLSPTEFAVQDMTGVTYKVHFTDILSTDKLTATAQGALARGEVPTTITTAPQEEAMAETTTDENGITMGGEVTVDGRVGTVRARTENGDYVVAFEDESGNYENAEVEVYTPTEMASLMGVAPMPTETTESTTEGTPTTTEVATTEDGSVDIEQMSAEDAAKVLVERAGTIEEAIAQVKQVIETVTEERKKMAKAEKKASLNDVGKKSAELQAMDTRLEFYGEVLGVLEGMLAEQQKQTMTEAQNIAEEAGVAAEPTAPSEGATATEESKETEIKPTVGLIRNGAEMKFTDNVIRMVDFIAQRLGITVEFVDGLKNDAGQPINGDIKGKHVRISTKGDRGVKFIVGHEFFHRIKDNVDEATYNKYIGALKEFLGEERWEEALNEQKSKYRAHNVAVAKKSMERMTPEEVAAIAQQLGANIEGLSAEDAKAAVARAAMRKAEQGDEVARALFPTMLTYSDALMLEETAADISGEMVANLDAFSNFVEDNKSEYAIIRGIHKALRYIHDMFASFGQTTRQRKVKRLVKNLENIMAEAVKNERANIEKARKDANTPVDNKVETTDKGDVEAVTNEKTGQGKFSLSTYREGGRGALADFLDSRVAEEALTPNEAAEMMQQMDDIYEACTTMADKYEPFGQWSEAKVVEDKDGNPVFSVIKANGDYAMNLDFSLVCKKRRTLDAVLNNMVKRGMIKSVSQKDTTVAKINEVIRKYGFETACALCFVDARRFQVIKTARQFCDLYNDMVDLLIPKKSNIAVNEFNFANRADVVVAENSLDMMSDDALNIEAVRKIGYKVEGKKKDGSDKYGMSVMAKIARHLVEHPEDRKHLSPSDFISTAGFDRVKEQKPAILSLYNAKKGTGGPKAAFSDVQYLNDIIRSNWKVDEAYAVGGVRLQSFCDYVPRMVFDYIQMVAELAAKKLPVHASTKEALFAKTFGLTGMKINLSLVPDVVEGGVAAGLDAEGNYVWKQGETFPYEEAIALQNAEGYRNNCGTIAVGVSDAHILKMLDDDNIRMVIPYHKSGLPKQVAKMNNVAAFTDYTNVQNTTKDGKAITKEEAKEVPNYNELLREHKDARKAAQAYVDWCTERGYTPKFAKFATHPNYYKLLEDFTTMVDGKYVPQEAVTFTFPTEESAFGGLESLIEQGLEEDAVLEGQRDVKVDAIVEEVGEVLGVQPKFSLSEETTQIFDAAKAKFGTTYDMREAGYILPDGSMLDFSGRHQVEGDASFLNGDRTVDHREISDIAYDTDGNETGINTDLGDFLDRGAIRIDSNAGAINLNVAPTKAQKDRLKRLIERNDGYVYIDFGKGWDTEHYAEYEAARASRVLGDIERYFDEGIKPAGNVRFSLQETNDRFNAELATLTEENAREKILNVGTPSSILLACGIENKPIRLYGAKLLSKVRKHGYDLDDLKNLPLAISEPIAVFNGSKPNSFAILTELRVGDNNILAALSVGKGGHDVDFNIIASVYDKRGDSVARWVNDGKMLWVDKKKALDYFSVSAPLAEAQNNQELISTANIIQNFQNPKIEARNSLITPEMDATYLDAVERGDMETAQKMVMEAAKLAMPNTKVVDEDGNPKVVYHGSKSAFNVFRLDKFGKTDAGFQGKGFYFTPDEKYAQIYGAINRKFFLNITNPIDAWKNEVEAFAFGSDTVEDVMARIENMKEDLGDKYEAFVTLVRETITPERLAEINMHDGTMLNLSVSAEYVAGAPNQIKSADPITYDDNGNVIPLSERFNPEKEDIRFSLQSEEDARFERKVAFLTDLVREYNIPLPTFIAQTKEEFVRMVQDNFDLTDDEVEANRAEIERMEGAYVPEDEIVLINGGAIRGREQMSGCVRHEFGHYITKKHLLNDIRQAANTLGEDALKRAQQEFLRGYSYKEFGAEGVVNELVSYLSETPTIQEIMSIFEGNLEVDEFIGKLQAQLEARNDLKEKVVYIALLPLAKKNIELQKKQYGSEKENIIVISRKDSSGRGNSKSEGGSSPSYSKGFSGTQTRSAAYDRRGEGADAQEVTRYMLPDPDPSEVFYDEIPIFDEQGNEVDFNTLNPEEAKAILDSKVRQMLEAEYEHNISAIRKEAREARQAIIDRYNEEKGKRKKNNKPSRTNAARIDDILGDKPFESLPYEDQALILIATGQAKIRWSDKGAQRGLASELGLKGSKGDKHAYRSIWSGATKSFNEVVHDWWESIGGQERGIDDQDLRNALIEAFQSVQNAKDAMGEIIRKYDDLSAERDAALAEVERMENKDLREAKAAYEQHYANFELAEGEERAAYHDRAAQFFANQNLSRTDEILEDLTNELERQKRKIERLKAENKDIYTPLAEGIQKSKDIILHALERLRLFAGMEEVDLNDVARLINLVKTARSQRQVENLGAQATALVQRISIKKAKANLGRLLSLKLSNTDIIHKMLAESETWTKEEREAILKHLWKVSRNGLRVSKAVHRDTKEIFDELKRLVDEFRKEKLKGLNNEQKALVIETKLKAIEAELHPEVVYDKEGNVQDNSNLPTDFNAENKHLAKYLFKTYLEMLAAESAYHNASKVLREKIDNGEKTDEAQAEVAVTREDYLHALTQLNNTLEHLILKGKDELRDWNAQKEKHEIEIRKMGIEAIGGEKAQRQGKRSKWGARQRARWNTSVNAPYWTFETVLEKIDHKTPYKRGKFYTYFVDKWSDANDDLITRYMGHFEELGEAMRKCFPDDATFMNKKRNPYRMFQYIMRKAESTPIGTITYKEGDSDRQMVLNVANAMYIIAMWRQPRYKEAMVENGITQQDIDTLMQNIEAKEAGFIGFMNWVNEKFLPSTRLEYDVVFRKMNGGSMPKEVNYFPARVAAHQEVDLANIENGAMPTTPTALKDRTSHNIMPEMGMDYFKVLEAHIEDMDKWAAYAELTADLNVLLSSDEFRRRLNEYMGGLGGDGGGKGSLYELFKQTSLIATGLYRGDAGMQAFLGKLQKAWATSNIAFRGWTALKQISSVTTGMFDNLRFYKHALKAASIVGIYSEIKDAMAVSPSLRQRWKSGAAGMEALAREAQRADGYTVHRGAYEKSRDVVGDAIKLLVRAGMTPNAAVDLLSCSIIVNSVYETEIARLTGGKREATEEEKRAAVRKAERAFNTTQQSSEGAYLAPVQANPAFGVLTTYMNASFALHRKRMAGVKELWKLMTSKEYRRFIKDEYGADAAKMSAVDAMKDIMSGIAGELSFAAMGWGLMEFMSWVNSWFNDDDDDDDTAAAKAEFADIWWQSFLNGYLGGSLATSIMQGFDTSLTPAYDEFISDVKGVFDDKGDAVSEAAQVATKYGLGVDLKSLYKIGVGVKNLFEEEERTGAILMLINAPERYVKAFVGDRREGETMEEYQTRIVRFYTLFDDVKYDEYFDKDGKYIGEDAPSIIMSKTKAQALRKEYEAAYRKDVLYHYGGKEAYASYMDTEKKYKDICEILDWKAETEPSKEKRKLSDMHIELAYEQKQVAKKAEKRKNWVGSEEDYYDKLMDEQKAKDELINQYYEYIKQSGLGAY